MEFTVVKKGYSPKEVNEYIAAVKREYENAIVKQRERIKTLLEEKAETEKELAAHRNKSGQISKAIVSAVAKAEEIERLSRLKYNQEIARLKAFHEKWTRYYDRILDEYPLDARLKEAGDFNRRMDGILSRVEHGDEIAAEEEESEPLRKIGKYFAEQQANEKAERASTAPAPETAATAQMPIARAQAATRAQAAPKKDYADRSPSGFSFEEALNPTEDLEDILKDLGVF